MVMAYKEALAKLPPDWKSYYNWWADGPGFPLGVSNIEMAFVAGMSYIQAINEQAKIVSPDSKDFRLEFRDTLGALVCVWQCKWWPQVPPVGATFSFQKGKAYRVRSSHWNLGDNCWITVNLEDA